MTEFTFFFFFLIFVYCCFVLTEKIEYPLKWHGLTTEVFLSFTEGTGRPDMQGPITQPALPPTREWQRSPMRNDPVAPQEPGRPRK